MKKSQTSDKKVTTAVTAKEQLDMLRTAEEKEKCIDMNYMVYQYGIYHNDKVNQLIHIVFVPIIIYTWYVMMCHLKMFPNVSLGFEIPIFGDQIGGGFWINAVVSGGYFLVDWKTAMGVALWYWPAMVYGNYTWMNHSHEIYFGYHQFWFMNAVNIFSWVMQFIGHALFEKRAPAILDNLGFALLAPFFITFEVMNTVFGFKEGKRMQQLRELIEQDIKEFHEQGKTKP